MAMGKGAKIAIGCGVVAVVAVIVAVVAVVGLGMWVKGKAGGAMATLEKTSELEQEVSTIPYTPPADGVISEDQLLRYLEVRKAVYAVFDANRALIERKAGEDKAGVREAMNAVSAINEIRATKLQAQVDQGMGHDEYAFLTQAVYHTAWAAALHDSSGGKSASQVTQESFIEAQREVAEAMEQQDLTEEGRRALETTQRQLDTAQEQAQAAAARLDIPAQNVALFKKHEDEIKKYSMSGLELVGL